MRQQEYGEKIQAYQKSALSGWEKRTTSGQWEMSGRAGRVQRLSLTRARILAAAGQAAPWGATATDFLKSGIWCSCSIIKTQKENSHRCQNRALIPAWGLKGSPQ